MGLPTEGYTGFTASALKLAAVMPMLLCVNRNGRRGSAKETFGDMYTVTWGALKQRAIKACQKRALKACTAAPGNAGPTAEQLNMLHAFVARALRGPHGDVVSDRAARFDPLGMRAFMARELAVQAIRAWAVEDAAKLVETYPEIVPAKSRAGHVTAVVSGTGDTARITIFAHAQ